jgi:energy-coupling factor transport system ATP-binding protein
MEIFATEHLSFTYPGRKIPALKDISFNIASGEFVVLCGASGCGKTTLLRQLKPNLAAHGTLSGEIRFSGTPMDSVSERDLVQKIGFVMQNPDSQIVTDKVWHELAFGLESLGLDTATIRLRVAEMSAFFGISHWFHKDVSELSGGQRQLLALAAVMAMQPQVLLLDEPTSQLDPIAASEFLETIGRINRDLGTTVIIIEHRLEEALPLADRVIFIDDGSVIANGTPRQVGEMLRTTNSDMFLAMPVPMRVWAAVSNDGLEYSAESCPISVREGRDWLDTMAFCCRHEQNLSTVLTEKSDGESLLAEQHQSDRNDRYDKHDRGNVPLPLMPLSSSGRPDSSRSDKTPAVELNNIWFRYHKDSHDILKGATFKAYAGQITALLGGNAAGKSTALGIMAGLNKPIRGKAKLQGIEVQNIPPMQVFDGLLGVLPQNPQAIFTCTTVKADLNEILADIKISAADKVEAINSIVELCQLQDLLESHPYDLSGGEQQRAALAKVLLLKPKILLLDEPTKGFDAQFKVTFADILHNLTAQGVAVVMACHDIEFCAEFADVCVMLFDGDIVSQGEPRKFFSGNSFYTSTANRMARHLLPQAIIAQDIIEALGAKSDFSGGEKQFSDFEIHRTKATASVKFKDSTSAVTEATNVAKMPVKSVGLDNSVDCPIAKSTIASERSPEASNAVRPQKPTLTAGTKRPAGKAIIPASALSLIAIPITIAIGILLGNNHYNIISIIILLEAMLPFALQFEGRKPQAREIVLIATLTGIAIAGRMAFFMVPQFKPVVALIVIAGAAMGKESGFLIGALTAIVSNMFFGQGPWTPWQMFALGSIGFMAGAFFSKNELFKNKILLAIYGAIVTLVIYGGLTNTAMVIMYQPQPTLEMFIASYAVGVPLDMIHAAGTVFFVLILAKAMLEKLARVKTKYGLVGA